MYISDGSGHGGYKMLMLNLNMHEIKLLIKREMVINRDFCCFQTQILYVSWADIEKLWSAVTLPTY